MFLFLLHFQKWLMYVLSVQIIVQWESCKTTIIYENFAWFTEFEIEPSFGLLLVLHFNLYGDYILCRLDSPEEMWKWNQEKTLKWRGIYMIWVCSKPLYKQTSVRKKSLSKFKQIHVCRMSISFLGEMFSCNQALLSLGELLLDKWFTFWKRD